MPSNRYSSQEAPWWKNRWIITYLTLCVATQIFPVNMVIADMNNMDFHQIVKRESEFKTWGGHTRSTTGRFHHLLAPPDTFGGYHITSMSRPPGAEPALDWIIWNLSERPDSPPQFVVHVMEYPTVKSAHEGLIHRLASITRTGVNFAPVTNGPGDVHVLEYMARDNLLVQVTPVERATEAATTTLLEYIDTWLLTDWPHRAARVTKSTTTLNVRIVTSDQTVHTAAPLEFRIDVSGPDGILESGSLAHRVSADPGRIIRSGSSYLFYGFISGNARICVEIVSPEGYYGQDSATIHVVKP